MSRIIQAIAAFLGPVATAIRGRINLAELVRVIVLAVAAGSFSYATLVALLRDNLARIVTDPDLATVVALFLTFLTALVDLVRRWNQGRDPEPPVPPPAPRGPRDA